MVLHLLTGNIGESNHSTWTDPPPNVVLLFYSGLLFSSHEVVIIEMLLINPVEGHGRAVMQAWDLIMRRWGGKTGKPHPLMLGCKQGPVRKQIMNPDRLKV